MMPANSSAPVELPGDVTPRLHYLPGLDGLRAIAVIAVLLYHAELSVWGGFLGVESFFVLSGFLITSLLVGEWRLRGRINLVAFWLRRARRLLPALFLLLAVVLAFALLLLRSESSGLGGDTLAALGYVMNWHLIFSDRPYFDPTLRPPLLQHLWSLAIEEQFYLLWPLLCALGMRYLRSTGLLVVLLAGAAGSVGLMTALYDPGADPSRVYYGTDTRAAALMLGSALAVVWTPGSAPAAGSRGVGLALDFAGLLALGGLLVAFASMYEFHPQLYRGGFALVAVGTAVLIAAVAHPGARLVAAVMAWAPLRWIGLRSYGIYLWHWPVFQVTRPYQDLPLEGWALLALRLTIVVVLAELSFRLVEMPVRRGALGRAWNRLRAGRPEAAQPAAPTTPAEAKRPRAPAIPAPYKVIRAPLEVARHLSKEQHDHVA